MARGAREINVALPRHLGTVGDAGEHVWLGELRLLVDDVPDGHAIGEEIENQGDPDPVTSDTGLAEADLGID